MTTLISVYAAVDPIELPMMVAASEQLEDAFGGGSGPAHVQLTFSKIGNAPLSSAGPLVVTSLLSDALATERKFADRGDLARPAR